MTAQKGTLRVPYERKGQRSAPDWVHHPVPERGAHLPDGPPGVRVVATHHLPQSGCGRITVAAQPLVPCEVKMEPLRGHTPERSHERPDVAVYVVDAGEVLVSVGVDCDVLRRELAHHARIRAMHVRVHDGACADASLEGRSGDVVRESTPAGDVEEKVAGIVVARDDTDLVVANAPGATPGVAPRFSRRVLQGVEPGPLEALAEVQLVKLYAVASLDLERREVLEQGLQRPDPHEPGGLLGDADPLGDLVARQVVDEAFGIGIHTSRSSLVLAISVPVSTWHRTLPQDLHCHLGVPFLVVP